MQVQTCQKAKYRKDNNFQAIICNPLLNVSSVHLVYGLPVQMVYDWPTVNEYIQSQSTRGKKNLAVLDGINKES